MQMGLYPLLTGPIERRYEVGTRGCILDDLGVPRFAQSLPRSTSVFIGRIRIFDDVSQEVEMLVPGLSPRVTLVVAACVGSDEKDAVEMRVQGGRALQAGVLD